MSSLPPSSGEPPAPAMAPPAEPASPVPPSLTQPPRPPGVLSHPQIVGAIITGVISVLVAVVGIVPALLDSGDKTPTVAAALLITFTPSDTATTAATPIPTVVPTAAPTDLPEETAVPRPTIVDTNPTVTALPVPGMATAAPVIVEANRDADDEPNIRLYFDNVSFTIRNQRGGRKSLAGVTFYSDEGRWNAEQWGLIHRDLTNKDCLRLRDVSTSQRNPPAECQNLLALLLVGPEAIFWRDNDGFRVERGGVEIGVCASSPCDLYLPRD